MANAINFKCQHRSASPLVSDGDVGPERSGGGGRERGLPPIGRSRLCLALSDKRSYSRARVRLSRQTRGRTDGQRDGWQDL